MSARRTRAMMLLALCVLLAIPRLARMAYHGVWIEDESYLNGAFMLARGFLPYRDFPLPHLPALEALMASVFLVAPITIRTAELVTQIAVFTASLLVFRLGERLGGTATGICAALIFATSALLFRYHVFEREVFDIVPVLGAALVVSRRQTGEPSQRVGAWAGLLLFAALAIKLTAVAAVIALGLQLWLEGRRRAATRAIGIAIGLLIVSMAGLTVAFGANFIVQVIIFRAVHATFPSLIVKVDELRYTMDVSLALGLVGTALLVSNGERQRWAGPLLQLLCGLIVLVLLNPTYWAHTGIELLPWFSLTGGYALAEVWRSVQRPGLPVPASASARRRPVSSLPRPGRGRAFVLLGAAAGLVLFITPIRNLNWQAGDGSVYGFGYRDRSEIDRLAEFVRAHARPDEAVATPPIIAFAANRREVVPYAEVAGEIDELTTTVRQRGYFATLTDQGYRDRSFWDSVESSKDVTKPSLEAALAGHQVAVLINDSSDDLMPVLLTDVPPNTLERSGYGLELVSSHYEAWIPNKGG